MRMKTAALLLLIACVLGGCAARPFAGFEDPRPEGRLGLSERSRCEVPDAPPDRPNWCDYPHEVRAFIDRRAECDHFRGEPWPEGDSAYELERRKELTAAMKTTCGGSDAELARLRARYQGDADVSAALKGLESDIE